MKETAQAVQSEQPQVQPSEPTVKISEVSALVDAAVKAALAAQRHQHTAQPVPSAPELAGRSREEGVLIVSAIGETKGYSEVGFNDGTVRRDYK